MAELRDEIRDRLSLHECVEVAPGVHECGCNADGYLDALIGWRGIATHQADAILPIIKTHLAAARDAGALQALRDVEAWLIRTLVAPDAPEQGGTSRG